MKRKRLKNKDSIIMLSKRKDYNKKRVEVIIERFENHPSCPHGPTLLFSSSNGRFFACSACRNGECSIYISENDWNEGKFEINNKKYLDMTKTIDHDEYWLMNLKLKSYVNLKDRGYCFKCNKLFIKLCELCDNSKTILGLTYNKLNEPTLWLPPLSNDKIEAQYFFNEETLNILVNTLNNNYINKVLCIGTPRLHEYINKHTRGSIKSLLLDLDKRFYNFNSSKTYLNYNMFNHYFFNGDCGREFFNQFITCDRNERLAIVMDPPFGGRVEPLANTIKLIYNDYKTVNGIHCLSVDFMLDTIWIFPYFSEAYIRNMLPRLLIHDYQVQYGNHEKFHNQGKKSRKYGSPIRLFTNIPHSTIDLSHCDNYRYCNICCKYVASINVHCFKCNGCTSRNGMSYVHCDICRRCVKPTFFHCTTCLRCCQRKDHVCNIILPQKILCYNCKEVGHKQAECPLLNQTIKRRKSKK